MEINRATDGLLSYCFYYSAFFGATIRQPSAKSREESSAQTRMQWIKFYSTLEKSRALISNMSFGESAHGIVVYDHAIPIKMCYQISDPHIPWPQSYISSFRKNRPHIQEIGHPEPTGCVIRRGVEC